MPHTEYRYKVEQKLRCFQSDTEMNGILLCFFFHRMLKSSRSLRQWYINSRYPVNDRLKNTRLTNVNVRILNDRNPVFASIATKKADFISFDFFFNWLHSGRWIEHQANESYAVVITISGWSHVARHAWNYGSVHQAKRRGFGQEQGNRRSRKIAGRNVQLIGKIFKLSNYNLQVQQLK